MLNWKVCGIETCDDEIEVEGEKKVTKVKKIREFKCFEEVKPHMKLKQSMFPPSLEEA